MAPATTSGSDAAPKGDTKSREHNQGNQGRKFTPEQKASVIRVRKCAHTAFYEILGVEKASSDGEIKKAYRKLSLLTHPDKNGYDGSDEAFKMVSRAFQILSDSEKKEKYDRYGGDPDSRFGSSAPQASPFSGGFQRPQQGGGRGPMFEDEISPEELFNRFFGGGGGGGFGNFGGGGSQFVFNMGGGPGFRVHQFGGGRPQRRPRGANDGAEQPPQSLKNILTNLLPIIALLILPILTSLFSSGDSRTAGPEIRYEKEPPYTSLRTTPQWKFEYYMNPEDITDMSPRALFKYDKDVEMHKIKTLQYECELERQTQRRMAEEAQGWFFIDADKMMKAKTMERENCNKLYSLGITPQYY